VTVELQPFGEVIEYIRGITFDPEDLVEPSTAGAVACMRTKNIQESLDTGDMIAVPSSVVRRDDLYLRSGDMLISSANSWELVGKACSVPALPFLATAGGFIAILRSKGKLDPRYMAHWVRAPATQHLIRRCARKTTNIANLSVPQLESLDVPVPSMPEQRRIADILDKADAIRRKRKQAIALTDDLLRSTFLDMFGDPVAGTCKWQVRSLGSLVSSIDYGVTASADARPIGPKFLRITDIQDGRVDWRNVPHCECDDGVAARAALSKGDIVFARTGATTGKSFLIQECPVGAVFASYLIRVRPDPLVPEFLFGFFQSPTYWRQIRSMAEGAAQPGVNASKLAALLVPIPPLATQEEYAHMHRRVANMRAQFDCVATEAESLFHAVSQRAFAGMAT
jgi:type I restriction enzyme S subunit